MTYRNVALLSIVSALACGGSDPQGDGSNADTTSASSSASGSSSASDSTSVDGTGSATDDPSAPTTDDPSTTASTADTSATDATDDGPSTDDTSASSSDDGGTTGIGGEDNVLYVRSDGQDGDPGTIEAPMRTIQWAIAQAESLGGIDTIRVAEGDYGYDYANDDHIVVVDGVSLFGGYREDWGDRDPTQYVTRVVDETPTPIPSSGGDPHRAIEVPSGVGADTIIDGFRVEVGIGQFRAAVYMQGDATVTHNVLAPTVDEDSVATYGVTIFDASPAIVANRIDPDVVDSSGQVMGISSSDSDGFFANNLIDLSGVSGYAYGMWLSPGAPTVLANSIWLPEDVNQTGIWISGSQPRIENNLIESENLTAVCIWSVNASSVPSSLRANVLDCNYTFFGSDPLRSWTTIMQVEDGLGATAEDNVKLAANVTSPASDMMLSDDSPCTVTQGGADITADVAHDFAGVARSVALSIGAREHDGGCQ